MAPTPYTPNGRLDIVLPVDGLTHRMRFPVNIATLAGNDSTIQNYQPLASNPSIEDAGQAIWDLMKEFWNSDATAPTAELFERDENIFIPVGTAALTGGGTSVQNTQQGGQLTITFKDEEQHLYKIVMLEGVWTVPQYGSPLVGAFADLTAGFITPTVGLEPHDFVRTRADLPVARALFYTATLNRKVRRARGLAG